MRRIAVRRARALAFASLCAALAVSGALAKRGEGEGVRCGVAIAGGSVASVAAALAAVEVAQARSAPAAGTRRAGEYACESAGDGGGSAAAPVWPVCLLDVT